MENGKARRAKSAGPAPRTVSLLMASRARKAAAALSDDVELLFFGSDDFPAASLDALVLCQLLADAGPRIGLRVHDARNDRARCEELGLLFFPALVIRGKNRGSLRFLGTPSGYCLPALVEALAAAAAGESGLDARAKGRLAPLGRVLDIKVFVSPESEHSLRNARHALRMAVESPLVRTEVINRLDFPVMSRRYNVGAAPRTLVNRTTEIDGARSEADFIERVLGAVVPQAGMHR